MHRSFIRACILLSSGAIAPLSAFGHHAASIHYDMSDFAEIEGRITSVHWANPHTVITVDGREDGSNEAQWRIEANAAAMILRSGVSRESIAVGDSVRAAGYRGRSNANAMFLRNLLLPDGREWTSSASIEPRWTNNLVAAESTNYAASPPEYQQSIFKVWSLDESTLPAVGPPRPLWNDSYPLTQMAKQTQATWGQGVVNPYVNCANGMPAIMDTPIPMQFVRDGDNIVLHFEELDARRIIRMNDDPSAAPVAGAYGYSTGQWDDDSLVVRTVAINWLWFDQDGIPLTEDTEILERFSIGEDGKFLNYTATVTDNSVFTQPVVLDRRWVDIPSEQVGTYECEWDESTL